MTTYVTPVVRKAADRLGVALAQVTGTGVGGRIRLDDVYAKAGVAPPAPVRAVLTPSSAVAGATTEQRRSPWDPTKMIPSDAYAANPLADAYRETNRETYAAAVNGGAPPTLFSSGDLPVFTASGIDPSLLARLPWTVRHVAARADLATAHRLFDEYLPNGQRDDAIEKADSAAMTHGNDLANIEYQQRVSLWVRTSGVPDYSDPAVTAAVNRAMAQEVRDHEAAVRAQDAAARRAASDARAAQVKAQQAASAAANLRRGPQPLSRP